MRRAHAYVAVYADHELSTVVARERYHQQLVGVDGTIRRERTLPSDYLLLQLPDEDGVAVRDVYEVDGTTVADRAGRLKNAVRWITYSDFRRFNWRSLKETEE